MRKILLKSTMKVHKFAGKKERKKEKKKISYNDMQLT